MNRKLNKGEEISILTLGGNDYLAMGDTKPVYILYPGANQVHPNVEAYYRRLQTRPAYRQWVNILPLTLTLLSSPS